MSNNEGNLLFLTDRDIHDGLMSAKVQITSKTIREFLFEKGIFVSENASREKLIEYFSGLFLDYYDVQEVIEQLSTRSRREKVRSIDLDGLSIDRTELREIMKAVEQERMNNFDEVHQSVIIGNTDKIAVNIEYNEVDLSKTRLRQRKIKDAHIEAEILDDGQVRIRFPDNSRAEDIVSSIQKMSESRAGVIAERKEITLFEINDREIRGQFFVDLIANMNKLMKLENVTKVAVDSRLADDAVDVEEDAGVDTVAVGGSVHKAILSGSSVLTSSSYQEMIGGGFYLSKLGWQMIETKTDGNKLEFEAYFSDAPICKKFSCQVVGLYTPRNGGFVTNRKKLTDEQGDYYFKLLEAAAYKAFEHALESYALKGAGE